uniref:Potassium channel homolog n=1 Tax=Polyorchis penicillatus TaxID=6091 RepID=Q26095_POLPE|nr:potassium channel homolog [Polyorchis penicillatus]
MLPVLTQSNRTTSEQSLYNTKTNNKSSPFRNGEPVCNPVSSPVKNPNIDDNNNKKVIINVSGKKFETYLTTLMKFPDSLLGDPKKRNLFLNKQTGEYFFDRHRKAFNGILYYYQSNGVLECPFGLSESIFIQEVLFFEIDNTALLENSSQEENENSHELPSNPYLCKIWVLFEQPSSSIYAKIVAIISVLVILISIVVFCLETIPSLNPDKPEGSHMRVTWFIINTICNSWFTLEYLLRLIASPNKLQFVKSTLNIVDLVSIIPYYVTATVGENDSGSIAVLRVVRVIRVIRIFKLTRHSRGLHILANTISASLHELCMLVLFLAIGVVLFSSAAYYAESANSQTGFKSIPHGFWWAVVTMTTVGYGDLFPSTYFGKMVGALCAISGVLVIALPVPVIVSNFEYYYKEEQNRRQREHELQKKELLDGQLNPIRDSIRMMTEASIILAGGTDNEEGDRQTPDNNINAMLKTQNKYQNQFTFLIKSTQDDEMADYVNLCHVVKMTIKTKNTS